MKEGISDRLCYHWENVFSVEDDYRRILTNKTLWDKYESIRKAKSCFQATNNKIWLERRPWERASELYRLYLQNPKLSADMGREKDKERGLKANGELSNSFEEAINKGDHVEIQAIWYLEHLCRIRIIESTIRYVIEATKDVSVLEPDVWKIKIGDKIHRLPIPRAPESLIKVVKSLLEFPELAFKFPVFMQYFLWAWGGFIWLPKEDDEYRNIASQIGVSPDYIPKYIDLFDKLFPIPGGESWFRTIWRNSLKIMILVPWHFIGLGVKMRKIIYGENAIGDYDLWLERELRKREDSLRRYPHRLPK